MRFKGVVFDLDGTLLDTLEDIGDAVNRTLAAQGFPVHDMDAYRFFVGDGFRMLIARALPESKRSEDVIDRCMQIFQEDYGRNWNQKTRPYEKVPEMLAALARRPLKLAVLSNKAHEFTEKMAAALLPRGTFHVVWGHRPGIPRKPHPRGALEIARILDVQPSECLFLGDSGVDMQTARVAGMFPVGAGWGFRPAKELYQNGCRVLITDPMAIMEILAE